MAAARRSASLSNAFCYAGRATMIGEVLGSYKVVSRLGQGGMGVVYVAEHPLLGSRAVIKMLLPEMSAHKDVVERFFNEAKAATRIKHPGIVQIFDFGFHSSGSAYIVMELLEGETLTSRIKRGPIAPQLAAVIVRQVASALGAAHSAGIIHRDLKPDNIFLVPDPDLPERERVKILDFGIAKLAASQSAQTRTGDVFGTPLYMSPEQCRNAAGVDARTDIYAVGCILYEMLTGRPPFTGEGVAQLVSAHMFEEPKPPSELVGGVPPSLEITLMRTLAKSPDERQRSMSDLAAELDGRRISTPIPTPMADTLPASSGQLSATPAAATPSAPVSTTLGRSVGQLVRGERRRPRGGLVIGALALGVGGTVAIVLSVRGGGPDGSADDGGSQVTQSVAPMPPLRAAVAPDATVQSRPQDLVGERMRSVLTTFLRWSASHSGSACPTADDLGTFLHDSHAVEDSWGRPLKISCADQPADQIVGVVSAGPDGAFGTSDDISSWTLGHEVTDLVRGPRWAAATPSKPATPAKHVATRRSVSESKGSAVAPQPPPPDGPATPKTKKTLKLDENGMPIDR
jgi:serine/threonine protein kinase